MSRTNRRAGTIYFKINGKRYDAKGNWSYHLGTPKRTAIIGADGIHGYTEEEVAPYIEGEITDRANLDVKAFQLLDGVLITLELANGKVVSLRDAWFAGDGKVQTKEANMTVRFEGLSADEVRDAE